MSDGTQEVRKVQINRRAYRQLTLGKRRKGKQYHMSREEVEAGYRAKGIIR